MSAKPTVVYFNECVTSEVKLTAVNEDSEYLRKLHEQPTITVTVRMNADATLDDILEVCRVPKHRECKRRDPH